LTSVARYRAESVRRGSAAAVGASVLRMPLHPVYDRRTGSLLHYTIYDRGYIHVSGWRWWERGRNSTVLKGETVAREYESGLGTEGYSAGASVRFRETRWCLETIFNGQIDRVYMKSVRYESISFNCHPSFPPYNIISSATEFRDPHSTARRVNTCHATLLALLVVAC